VITPKRIRLIGFFVACDVVGIVLAFFYSYVFRFYGYIIPVDPAKGIPTLGSYLVILPLFLAVHMLIFYIQGFYRSRLKRTKIDDFFFISLNAVLTIVIVFAVLNYTYAYSGAESALGKLSFTISRGFLVVYFISVILLISFLRSQVYFFMKRRYARGLNLQNVLIVGAGDMGRTLAQKLFQYRDLGFVVRGFLDDSRPVGEAVDVDGGVKVLGRVDDLAPVLDRGGIDEVYISLDLSNYAQILETLKVLNRYTVTVRLIPDLFQLLTLTSNIQDFDGIPVISVDEIRLRGFKKVVKRTIDIVASAGGLLVLSPLFLIEAALVRLTSRGPVFYAQERVGMDGEKFRIFKFRTMVVDAEKGTGPVMSKPGDPRCTPVGRFLRKYSLDEFPQLVNVLAGRMSLVGPRAERPTFVEEFRDKIPKYMLRHKMRSGLTGWAQVHGLRQDSSIEKRLEYDFYYIQNWSLSLDVKILWMTLRGGFIDKSL
jgi:exopolysaccharide biosynthesis polyprenyl glycosylphosphotransferase